MGVLAHLLNLRAAWNTGVKLRSSIVAGFRQVQLPRRRRSCYEVIQRCRSLSPAHCQSSKPANPGQADRRQRDRSWRSLVRCPWLDVRWTERVTCKAHLDEDGSVLSRLSLLRFLWCMPSSCGTVDPGRQSSGGPCALFSDAAGATVPLALDSETPQAPTRGCLPNAPDVPGTRHSGRGRLATRRQSPDPPTQRLGTPSVVEPPSRCA